MDTAWWTNAGMAAVDIVVAVLILGGHGAGWAVVPVLMAELGQALGSLVGEPGEVVGGFLGGYAIPLATALVLLGLNGAGRQPAPWLALPGEVAVLAGWMLTLGGLVSLGRGFSVLPQRRRRVRARGMYRVLRHPIYAGYAASALGSLCLSWSPWRGAVVAAFLLGTLIRITLEDAALGRAPQGWVALQVTRAFGLQAR